ncbi:hypothetical protein CapIbe_019105 [Capra ibex]
MAGAGGGGGGSGVREGSSQCLEEWAAPSPSGLEQAALGGALGSGGSLWQALVSQFVLSTCYFGGEPVAFV